MINKFYGVERDLKVSGDTECKIGCLEQSMLILAQLKSLIEKLQPLIGRPQRRRVRDPPLRDQAQEFAV